MFARNPLPAPKNFGNSCLLTKTRRETAMKTSLFIVLVVLLVISTLVVMNDAYKSSQHAWCAPMSTVRHHIKIGQG